MERLTPEQIRLLEELRELRDSGILTGDEFEFQVAKVLGRPLVVEPLPVDEEFLAPEDTPVAELLEYEFVESATSDEGGIQEEENRVVESPTTSDISASPIADIGSQQNKSGRRKVLIGTTTVGLVLVAAIGLVALVGGGKSDSTSSQVIDSTTTVTESNSTGSTGASTSLGNTQAPATSSQSGAITTTVPQNASSLNASQPTTETPQITTPVPPITTPVTNSVSEDCIVTDLRFSKSHSRLYYPSDPSHTVTFTATVLNDEKTGPYYGGSACDILLVFNRTTTDWLVGGTMKRVQPGTWTFTWNVGWIGPLDFCVLSQSRTLCNGPSVSLEVFHAVPPSIGFANLSGTPGDVVHYFDTISISVIIRDGYGVDASRVGIRLTAGSLEGQCGVLSLSSGNEYDGEWTADCDVPIRPPEAEQFEATIEIVAWGKYSDSTTWKTSFERR